jgi:hypothetical protein
VSNPSTPAAAGNDGRWLAYGLTREIRLADVAAGRYLLSVEAIARGTANPVVRETLITVR